MKRDDLGFNPAGYHSKVPTHVESAYINVLWDHFGADNKISGEELALKWAARLDENAFPGWTSSRKSQWMRDVRQMQNHLLFNHGTPILSEAGGQGGYWYCETETEMEKFYDTFRSRGLTGLRKAARGRQSILVDIMKQVSFAFDDQEDRMATAVPAEKPDSSSTPIEVVDAFIEKMMREPEKFADGLRKIGSKYGSILMPKEVIDRALVTARELEALLGGMQS